MPWRRSDEPAQGVRRAGRLKEETTSQTDLLTSEMLNERRFVFRHGHQTMRHSPVSPV